MTLLEEFEGLLEEEHEENLVESSEHYMKLYKDFCNNEATTFSGVYKSSIIQCIHVGETVTIPRMHVTMTIDISKIRDISKPRITEFKIPEFVEEIQCVGDENHSGFGFNEYGRNHLKSVIIPSSVYTIADKTFKMYRKLESVIFQDDSRLRVLGDEAFACCENLKDLDISMCHKITTLGKYIFTGSSVKTLRINSRLRNFDEMTFSGSVINKVYVDDRKYKFTDFINMLRDNHFEAFWI